MGKQAIIDFKGSARSFASKWKQIMQKVVGWTNSPTVNCWFCNEDFVIGSRIEEPFGWHCPGCHQYNGFDEDGDYDQAIPEQYELSKDDKTYCHRESFVVSETVLCHLCQQNQALKVGQLASFVPLAEMHYDDEVEAYDQYLESVYRLCRHCDDQVKDHLTRQDKDILQVLDRQSIQIKKTGEHDEALIDDLILRRVVKGRVQRWITCSSFGLCLLMAVWMTLISLRVCLELEKSWLRSHLPPRVYTSVYYTSNITAFLSLPYLPVYIGTGCCLLGLLCVGKKCVYIVDALHILHWLAVLIVHVLSPSWAQDVRTSVASFILCFSTTCVCAMCLTLFRHPSPQLPLEGFNWYGSKRKPKTVVVGVNVPSAKSKTPMTSVSPALSSSSSPSTPPSPLSSSLSSSPCSSPTLYPVGEPKNFFKPISPSAAPSISPPSSPVPVNEAYPEKFKSTYEVVRDGLESFSLGLVKTTGAVSSIWSLPSIFSTHGPPSPDSTMPNTAAVTTTTSQTASRTILSPSRLSVLSFSQPPSPGNFSSSPHSDSDSGLNLDSSHSRNSNNNNSKNEHTSAESRGEKTASHTHPPHIYQNQSFTRYRSESKHFSINPDTLDNQFLSAMKDTNEVAAPDSTSNEQARPQIRRSNRIAMRGKIVKPWPLKKSLSVNNMYDKPCDVHFLKKDNSAEKKGTKLRADSIHRKSAYSSSRDPYLMDNIAEFSDEDEDYFGNPTHRRMNPMRLMQGEEKKESKWPWTLLGVVIGISVTANFFLGLNVWMNSKNLASPLST